MSYLRGPAFWLGAVVLASLAGAAIASRQSPAVEIAPPKKRPVSDSDEIRELKRRVDKLEGERADLQKTLEATKTELKRARKETQEEIGKEIHTVGRRIDKVVLQGAADRVPIGAMIPYLGKGDTPPKGYVFVDGKRAWPKAPWVPRHLLKEKKLPTAEGLLIGGTTTANEVGTVSKEGVLTVEGKDLKVEVRTKDKDAKLTNEHAFLGNFDAKYFDSTVLLRQKGVGKGAIEAKLVKQTPPQYSDEYPGEIEGKLKIKLNTRGSLPPHLRCRWIIRIE